MINRPHGKYSVFYVKYTLHSSGNKTQIPFMSCIHCIENLCFTETLISE